MTQFKIKILNSPSPSPKITRIVSGSDDFNLILQKIGPFDGSPDFQIRKDLKKFVAEAYCEHELIGMYWICSHGILRGLPSNPIGWEFKDA